MAIAAIHSGINPLQTIAQLLLQRHVNTADGLGRVRVYLPSRRAAVQLEELLVQHSHGVCFVPQLHSITDCSIPVLSPWQITLHLANMLQEHYPSHSIKARLRIADTLMPIIQELLDYAIKPATLPQALASADMAHHWQLSQAVLEQALHLFSQPVTGLWHPALARQQMLQQAAAGSDPVYAIALTNITPAVLGLLQAVYHHQDGLVVLAGYDAEPAGIVPPAHPQYKNRKILQELDYTQPVPMLGAQPLATITAWERLLLWPADSAAQVWQAAGTQVQPAHIQVAAADNEQHEALVVAMKVRAILEDSNARCTIICPSTQLASIITQQLLRWEIIPDDSAATPLAQTAAGQFALHLLAYVQQPESSTAFLKLVKHPYFSFGESAPWARVLARGVELAVLRRTRIGQSWEKHLRAGDFSKAAQKYCTEYGISGDDLANWLRHIQQTIMPLQQALQYQGWQEICQLHYELAERFSDGRIWRDADGQQVQQCLQLCAAQPMLAGLPYYADFLPVILQQETTRLERGSHPRVEILGVLEAQWQPYDSMIVCGMNEGQFPPQTTHSSWLSTAMKQRLGLPDAAIVTGQMAHLLTQVFHAREVLLTFSHSTAQGMTMPSRFITRLQGLQGDIVPETAPWLGWAKQLDAATPAVSVPERLANPPLKYRKQDFSVSALKRLIQNPYEYYASQLLGLEPLDKLDQPLDNRDKGIIVHSILEQFLKTYPQTLPEDAAAQMVATGERIFADTLDNPTVHLFWWQRFQNSIPPLIAQMQDDWPVWQPVVLEEYGKAALTAVISLHAKADRIDRHRHSEAVRILDYKTGGNISEKKVRDGQEFQLLAEAWMVACGGFVAVEGIPKVCSYWQVSGKAHQPFLTTDILLEENNSDLIDKFVAYAITVTEHYVQQQNPYLAYPHDNDKHIKRDASTWAHLARVSA